MRQRFWRVRWRWFRREFNRRAHDRVYYDRPIAYRVEGGLSGVRQDVVYAHPEIAHRLRTKLAGRGRTSVFDPLLYSVPIYESVLCVERTWKWVRR